MLRDITIGQYIAGDTCIHRLDPRSKIILVLLFLIALLNTHGLSSYLIVTLFTFILLVLASIKPGLLWRGLKGFVGLIAMIALLGILFIPGTPWLEFGGFSISYEGLSFGAIAAARFLLLIMASSVLTYTTSPMRLLDGIAALLKPFKRMGLPSNQLALTMTVALCFLPVVFEEAKTLMRSQAARGADFSTGNLKRRASAFVPFIVPLVINAWNRAAELSVVMEARCYDASKERSVWHQLKMGPSDYCALALTALIAVGVICLRFVGGGLLP